MIDSVSLVRQAQRHQKAGDPRQARDLCCQVLEQDANHAEAWHLLGVIAYQARDYPLARKLLLRALSHDNAYAEYHNSLGAAQYALGAVDEAVESYRRALRLRPDHADAHSNLGVALLMRKRPAESIASFRAALTVNPNHCMALNNLGNALQALGDMEAAGVCYQRVLSLQADHAEARNNLGGVLRAMGRLDEAAEVYQQVLRQRPDMMEAHSNLGLVLHQLGRADEALNCYRTALRLQPHQPTIHNNLGILLRENGDLEGALACFRQALALSPDSVPFHVNLGSTLQQQGRLAEAMPWFHKALTLDPACAVARSNLLFALNYDTTLSAEAIFEEHCVFGRVQEKLAPPPTAPCSRAPEASAGRLRIGYVSPDFRSHALMRFLLPLLVHHDPVAVEITCYAEVPRPDAVTQHCRTLAHRWRSTCGLSDAQLADTIRADAIDILIDLAGHTAGNRLTVFTHRPAPVQATYLGYPNTTGLRCIDYLLSDRLRHPPGEPDLCTETVFRLDDFGCCFQAPASAPPVNPLPLTHRGRITFGSLHNLTKLNDAVLDLWCRALRAVPSARLLIFRDTLTGELREQMRRRLLERGIADERLDLRHGHATDGYLSVYHDIDVSLDVSPWGAGTTVYESAWMGVPMLTLRGKRFTDRASTAVLTCVGLPELIADDADDFVERARWLSANADWLARTRAELRGRMKATICDAAGFTRRLEAAYRVMWRRWSCQPAAPARASLAGAAGWQGFV